MTFYASVVINFHREGLIATPTLNSLIAARAQAHAAGYSLEFIAIVDKADDKTKRVVERFKNAFNQTHFVSFGDLGASREFGIEQASSDWVFMHDADDLFSTNWYQAFLDRLADGKIDQNTVYHTDIFARFGVEIDARKMIDSEDIRFHPLMMASEWYFSNKAVFNRKLLKRFPMPRNDVRRGIGNEDWTWASHTIAGGIRHSPLPETICFYRTKSAAISLGLTPGMIHDASELYSPETVIKLAVQRAARSAKTRGFAPNLVGRADPVIGEGPLPDWFWNEVEHQGRLESLITEFNAIRPTLRCYLPNLHYNVVSAVEYLMKDLDTRPKIFIFASAKNLRGADNIIDLFLRSAAEFDSDKYQPVLVLDEGPLAPSEMRILASYGAKLIAVEHLRNYYKIEDWYFCRTLLRPLVQYQGSIIIDTCSDSFALLFREFHKVLLENFTSVLTVYLDSYFDLLSPSLSNLLANGKHFARHKNAAMPVLARIELANKLQCDPHLHSLPLPKNVLKALERVTKERYREVSAEPPVMALSELVAAIGGTATPLLAHIDPPRVTVSKIQHNGATYYFYKSSQAWISDSWCQTAVEFLAKNPHLAICAPQITISRKLDGFAQARWHNYSNAARNFAATYEQVATGQNVPVIALVKEPICEQQLESPLDVALALSSYCAADTKRLASAYGESVAFYCPPEHLREVESTPPEPRRGEIYWQCYEDLTLVFARGFWDNDQLEAHFIEHGIAEGRKIPEVSDLDSFWSDTLFFESHSDGYKWWWEKGVIQTAAWRAAVLPHELLASGSIPENQGYQARTALSPTALRLVAEFDSQHLAAAYLPELRHHRLEWSEHKLTGLGAIQSTAKALGDDGITEAIVVPALDSGGAELVALWHYRAAQNAGKLPVIILSDSATVTPRFEAENLRLFNIPAIVETATGKNFGTLALEERVACLTLVIETLRPDSTHIIHAYNAYNALASAQAGARLRNASKRIYVSAFCPHIHPDGRHDGYFRDIPTIEKHVDKFIFDNIWFADQMRETYSLDNTQIANLAYPIDGIAPVKRDPDSNRNVLWASRLDAQKNPQIVGEIAQRMPDVTFHIYGRTVLGDQAVNWAEMPKNVVEQGPFFGVDSLPFAQMDAFLYTSRFDGMPNILLEIAARGLPIVTAPIGGIPELLGKNWPLYAQTPDDVDGFCSALEHILSDQELRQSCINAQIEHLEQHRSLDAFFSNAASLYVDQ